MDRTLVRLTKKRGKRPKQLKSEVKRGTLLPMYRNKNIYKNMNMRILWKILCQKIG